MSITTKKNSAFLKQLADNNLNLKTFTWNVPSGDIAAGIAKECIFPFPITVVGLSACNEVVPTNADIVFAVTDGTTALAMTLIQANTEVQEAEDQDYDEDTVLTISIAAAGGNTSENVCFQMHYIINKPEDR